MDYMSIYKEWLNDERLNEDGYKELKALENNEKDIEYRFGAELSFGTAGMRGIIGYGTNMMNIYTVRRATLGLANYIESLGVEEMNRGVAISYDTRLYSDVFAYESAGILLAKHINVYLFKNPSPVPMLSFSVIHYGCAAGIMITASHNPKEYNGYKVYGPDGAQLSMEMTDKVVDEIKKTPYFGIETTYVNGKLKGLRGYSNVRYVDKAFEKLYVNKLVKLSLSKDAIKAYGKKLRIVYTPVHGTGYSPMIRLLNKLKINVYVVKNQIERDPSFSTVKVPNPEYLETLSEGIKLANQVHADVVFGTDPDSDRLGVAIRDRNGEFIHLSGNQVGALIVDYLLRKMKKDNALPANGLVIKSFVSTDLVKPICKNYGIELYETPVGFKFIGEKVKNVTSSGQNTFIVGFEESCGYLRGTHAKDKDAIVAGMMFSEMVCYYESNNKKLIDILDEIYDKYGYYEDNTISKQYSGLKAMDEMNSVVEKVRNTDFWKLGIYDIVARRDYLTGVRTSKDGEQTKLNYDKLNCLYFELEIGGFVCLRPSGTEPKLKIYYSVKGASKEDAIKTIDQLDKEFSKML